MLHINSHKLMESSQGSWRIYASLVVKGLNALVLCVLQVLWHSTGSVPECACQSYQWFWVSNVSELSFNHTSKKRLGPTVIMRGPPFLSPTLFPLDLLLLPHPLDPLFPPPSVSLSSHSSSPSPLFLSSLCIGVSWLLDCSQASILTHQKMTPHHQHSQRDHRNQWPERRKRRSQKWGVLIYYYIFVCITLDNWRWTHDFAGAKRDSP